MTMPISHYRIKADRLLFNYDHARKRVREEKKALREALDKVTAATEAQRIIQTVAQKVQETAHERIASVVTRCLQTVFDDTYKFEIRFERKRGKTEALLLFTKNELELNPVDESGLGVVDVAAFALRLSCLMLFRPKVRRLLVLDEPFRFVDVLAMERVRSLLQTLSKEMNVQIVLVTHEETLEDAGKLIRLQPASKTPQDRKRRKSVS